MGDLSSLVEVDLAGDRLSEFARGVESRNPFLDNRINGPSANDVDVDAIHQSAFVRLTRLAREACDHRRGVGAVLWGEAGIGKSHLLSRLRAGPMTKIAPASSTCITCRPRPNICRAPCWAPFSTF